MALPLTPPLEPMLSEAQDDIPVGAGWLYEPKWDGFRALIFCDQGKIQIGSRKGQSLERYFPELVELFPSSLPDPCVVDGEIVIGGERGLDFEALQQRIHPAASRIAKLSQETPASFAAFDLLALGNEDLREKPLRERFRLLGDSLKETSRIFLTPQTEDPDEARQWFTRYEGAGLDGVIAKREELKYLPGERVMVKVKHARTVDCVVGGYRMGKSGDGVGSLLLGLYDDAGILHHVGHTSSFKAKERRELLAQLAPLEGGESFGKGRTPGGPSRWAQDKDMSWTAVTPSLVCEVAFDHLQGDRFRHATRFLRWRLDKAPKDCTYQQLIPPSPFSLEEIIRKGK
jgi:ATP-dependent DNA ligase